MDRRQISHLVDVTINEQNMGCGLKLKFQFLYVGQSEVQFLPSEYGCLQFEVTAQCNG
jgi:hypothetical protein